MLNGAWKKTRILMETMYDRLGDLLNQTLRDGFVKIVKKEDIAPQGLEPDTSIKRTEEKFYEVPEESILRNSSSPGMKRNSSGTKTSEGDSARPNHATVMRPVDPAIESACRLLGVTPDSTEEEIKSAYRQKIMYYHPDKHAQNEIMKKVATNKTMQVIDAYNLLMEKLGK